MAPPTISYTVIIDLSHAIEPGTPIWPGDPGIAVDATAVIEREGFFLQRLTLGEHSGTHLGSSAHFDPEGITADALPLQSLIRPAVRIDVRDLTQRNADYRLGLSQIERWEQEHGTIPEGSVALLNTGWDTRWRDATAYIGTGPIDNRRHTPGFSLEAARLLGEERGVIGLGIDTHGIDAGDDTEYGVNTYWLRGERFHLENLTNLDRLPPTGAIIVIGLLKITGSSGGPARVLALI